MAKKRIGQPIAPEEESQAVPDEEPARVINEEEQDEAPEGNGSISKAQAVRNALAEGHEEPGDIADFAREHYGLVIANQQVSAYKSQAKARARKAGGGEAARVIEEKPEESDSSDINQTELIREAVEAGHEKPAKGVAYIRGKHGVEINPKYYSIVKGKLGKVAFKEEAPRAEASEPKVAPARPSGRIEQVAASPSAVPVGLFDDLKHLRELKDRYGDDFQKMVEAIG